MNIKDTAKNMYWAKKTYFLILALFTTCIVNAENDTQNILEEIIVTAEKKEANLQDVPISITAFTSESLKESGIEQVADLQLFTPGLIYGENGGGQPYIRGIGTDILGIGSDSSVAIHVDNIYITRPFGFNRDFFDMERVEVLRGPQGTLYGRNTTGGSINIISAMPSFESEFKGDIEYGNYDHFRGTFAASGSIIDNKIAGRIALIGERRDGFTKNLFNGDELDNKNTIGGRGKLLFTPFENLHVILSAEIVRERNNDRALKIQADKLPAPIASLGTFPSDPRKVLFDTSQYLHQDTDLITAQINWTGDTVSFTSITGYQRHKSETNEDFDGSEIRLTGALGFEESKAYTQEVRLASISGQKLEWVAGVYYLHENSNAFLDILFLPFGFDSFKGVSDNKTDAYAVFAEISYLLSDRLRVTAGARYSYEKKDNDYNEFAESALFMIPAGTLTAQALGKSSWNSMTPKIGLEYSINNEVLIYASATKGFKSGGFNSLGAQDPFDEETVWSYEAGIKSTVIDNRVRANLSGFYYDYSNLQQNIVDANGIVAIDNAAEATIYGMEAEIEARPITEFGINLGLSFLDSKYDSFTNAFDPVTFGSIDVSGNELPRAPSFTLNLGVEYDFTFLHSLEGSLRGDYLYQDHMFFDYINDSDIQQKGFNIFNASMSLSPKRNSWRLYLYMRNIGNKDYIQTGLGNPALAGNVAIFAPPREYGVRLGYSY